MSAISREDEIVWHDAENGSYDADLELWRELAATAAGPVLELGCGTGRVALDLARRGNRVLGVDLEPSLVAAFTERASAEDLATSAIPGDIRALVADGSFPLIIVPMQTIQLLADSGERIAALNGISAHLAPNGVAAIAIVEGDLGAAGAPGFELAQPLPDVKGVDDWVYSSLPLEVQVTGGRISISRLRQIVSPDGDLAEEVAELSLAVIDADTLEAEALEAGLRPAGRREVAETDTHVASMVVLLEAAG